MANTLRSMTSFGRATEMTDEGRFTVEIHTLNRRHLEILFSLPHPFLPFEQVLRKRISAEIHRGKVSVTIRWQLAGKQSIKITPNLPLARVLHTAWKHIAEEVGEGTVDLSLLAQKQELLLFDEEIETSEAVMHTIERVVDRALETVMKMRQDEGALLQKEIESHLLFLEGRITTIETLSPDATQRQRQKLKERLEELLPGNLENEERLLREIALFAERVDITEESVRFRSHLQHFHKHLETGGPCGKTLEFLLQELGREINTIGSKAADASISQHVVECKSALEKIREQVNNIE